MIFEVKVKYANENVETGIVKVISELYLVDAISFADAEYIAKETLQPFVKLGDVDVLSMKKSKITVVNLIENEDVMTLFLVKFITSVMDLDSGKDIKTSIYEIVNADNFDNATLLAKERMATFLTDNVIIDSIKETKLLDFIQNFSDGRIA